MILIAHITVALTSLISSAGLLFSPTKFKLRLTYTLVGATFLSGSFLVITKPAHILQVCVEGLIFLGLTSLAIFSARHKLALLDNKNF